MIEGILMLLVGIMCLVGGFSLFIIIVPDIGLRDISSACFSFLAILTSGVLSLLGLFGIVLSLSLMNGDKIPYQVRYEEKCQMMGGNYRSESVYNVATKTHRESHYCEINGFEFEDIGA